MHVSVLNVPLFFHLVVLCSAVCPVESCTICISVVPPSIFPPSCPVVLHYVLWRAVPSVSLLYLPLYFHLVVLCSALCPVERCNICISVVPPSIFPPSCPVVLHYVLWRAVISVSLLYLPLYFHLVVLWFCVMSCGELYHLYLCCTSLYIST
jgi:hypothetical protein